MLSDRYIVVGPAKTGTTVIARTLQRTLYISNFWMEPKDLTEIEQARSCAQLVVKIVFDAWQHRLPELARLCGTEAGGRAPTVLFVIRDPRDELISRLHYCAYDFFSTRITTPAQRASWIE